MKDILAENLLVSYLESKDLNPVAISEILEDGRFNKEEILEDIKLELDDVLTFDNLEKAISVARLDDIAEQISDYEVESFDELKEAYEGGEVLEPIYECLSRTDMEEQNHLYSFILDDLGLAETLDRQDGEIVAEAIANYNMEHNPLEEER